MPTSLSGKGVFMDFGNLFNDAIGYTRETFAGHWDRLLIFIILGLPFSLVQFVLDPGKLVTGATIHWELVPWGPLATLVLAGILASFFISGYMVRIYRGMKPAPDFTGWASLFVDGIKLDIVMIVWFLPAVILGLFALAFLAGGLFLSGTVSPLGSPLVIIAFVILFIVAMILLIIASLFMTMGAIRFARTGSMAEGWRYSLIAGIIRRIGWGRYIIALVLYVVAAVLYSILVSLPAVIPYVGWIVPVALAPFLTIFAARYFTLVYEAGAEPPALPPVPPQA
jgi:Protein of unknown function (DUF4013)